MARLQLRGRCKLCLAGSLLRCEVSDGPAWPGGRRRLFRQTQPPRPGRAWPSHAGSFAGDAAESAGEPSLRREAARQGGHRCPHPLPAGVPLPRGLLPAPSGTRWRETSWSFWQPPLPARCSWSRWVLSSFRNVFPLKERETRGRPWCPAKGPRPRQRLLPPSGQSCPGSRSPSPRLPNTPAPPVTRTPRPSRRLPPAQAGPSPSRGP